MDRFHVAIIMDGNGRWALGRGLPRVAGHRAGAAAVRRVIEAAPDLGIHTLTLYAFSEDNWSRPAREVTALMKLLGRYLVEETERCVKNGVRLEAIGTEPDGSGPEVFQLLRRDGIVSGVGHDDESSPHQLFGGLQQSYHIGEQGALIADDLQFDEVRVQRLPSELGGADRLVRRITARGVGEVGIFLRADIVEQ